MEEPLVLRGVLLFFCVKRKEAKENRIFSLLPVRDKKA